MSIVDQYFETSKHHQESKIASVQNSIARLTEASKQSNKKALRLFPSPSSLSQDTRQPPYAEVPPFIALTSPLALGPPPL